MKRRVRQVPPEPPPPLDPEKLKAVVARALELRDKLSGMTDLLNAKIRECEETVASLKLGVEGSVQLGDATSLSFRSFDNKWIFIIDDGEYEEPLLNCSRAKRLQAVPYFSHLITSMVNTSLKVETAVADRLTQLDDLLNRMKGAP